MPPPRFLLEPLGLSTHHVGGRPQHGYLAAALTLLPGWYCHKAAAEQAGRMRGAHAEQKPPRRTDTEAGTVPGTDTRAKRQHAWGAVSRLLHDRHSELQAAEVAANLSSSRARQPGALRRVRNSTALPGVLPTSTVAPYTDASPKAVRRLACPEEPPLPTGAPMQLGHSACFNTIHDLQWQQAWQPAQWLALTEGLFFGKDGQPLPLQGALLHASTALHMLVANVGIREKQINKHMPREEAQRIEEIIVRLCQASFQWPSADANADVARFLFGAFSVIAPRVPAHLDVRPCSTPCSAPLLHLLCTTHLHSMCRRCGRGCCRRRQSRTRFPTHIRS